MRKICLSVFCLFMLFIIGGCTSKNEDIETLKKELQQVKTLNENLIKETSKVVLKCSGSFTLNIHKVMASYSMNDNESFIAIVSFFQSDEFVLHIDKELAGKLKEGEAYTFKVDDSSVFEDCDYNDFKNKSFSFEQIITSVQFKYDLVGLAKENETGLECNRIVVEEKK